MRLKLTQVLIVPTSRLSVDPSPNYLKKKYDNNDYGQKRRRVYLCKTVLCIYVSSSNNRMVYRNASFFYYFSLWKVTTP